MPPYSVGYFRPSRPSAPSFLNTSCAGNCCAASHSATCGLISFATKRRTVSAICSCSGVNCIVASSCSWSTAGGYSEARDAEGGGPQHARLGLARDREAQREHAARVARIDDVVVPQARGAEERRRLAVEPVLQRIGHRGQRRLVRLGAAAREL